MGLDWIERTIEDIADVVGGSTPSTKEHSNFDGDVPWLTPKDLSALHPRYVKRGERNLSRKGLAACSAQLVPRNSVLLSTRAPIGYLAIAENPIATNQGFRNLIVKPGYDHEFVYYWLSANVEELERQASGSTFKEISGGSLKKVLLRLPADFDEQRAIAHILGTLDDKIELNRSMNATLEAIARAIFKSWFVDFDPVYAKLEGRDPGLPAHIADLFPDRLVDSELGEIPEGWNVMPVGDAVEAVGGATPYTKNPVFWEDGKICWATPKDLSGMDSPILVDTSRKITEEGLSTISSGLLPVGTVLLSSRAPVGYLAISVVPTAINQGFIAMKCDGPVSNYFMLNWCHFNMEEIKQRASGTTFAEISKKAFRPIPIFVPPLETVHTFDKLVETLYERIQVNIRESESLESIRDTLLPKLISGELRIEDPQASLERVM
ncbi:MAG: restriction endonuclease subunit S [Anaerolineales bacterium]|nr:restriction endonuclease subunit S [Anaerolineales bacterium]